VRLGVTSLICCLFAAMLSLPARASGDFGNNCVTYAREVTGMDISGNAGDWWDNAAGSYRRGQKPEAGAVLVFRRSGAMWAGHVAVVARVVNAREILVNQANWPHGDVVEGAAVYDVSSNNDWTTVRVANVYGPSWGRTNPTFGFIYPDGGPAREEPVVAEAQPQPSQPQTALAHFAQVAVSPFVALTQIGQSQVAQPQPRAEPASAQAQPQTTQPQPALPQPRAAEPQPRFQLATAETEEADDDEPAPARHHATPPPRAPERAKADTPASRKELAAAARREREEQLAEAKAAKAKPDRHEGLEAKAGHDKPQQEKLAKADQTKAKQEKLAAAKADHAKAQQEKLAKAEQAKAERTKLAAAKAERVKQEKLAAKAEKDKAHQEKLAKAEQDKAERAKLAKAERDQAKPHDDTKTAATHDHPTTRHTHVARNEQPAQSTNIEQIAEANRNAE
jgi:hypothetical protein